VFLIGLQTFTVVAIRLHVCLCKTYGQWWVRLWNWQYNVSRNVGANALNINMHYKIATKSSCVTSSSCSYILKRLESFSFQILKTIQKLLESGTFQVDGLLSYSKIPMSTEPDLWTLSVNEVVVKVWRTTNNHRPHHHLNLPSCTVQYQLHMTSPKSPIPFSPRKNKEITTSTKTAPVSGCILDGFQTIEC
jgi:hypothetical protein